MPEGEGAHSIDAHIKYMAKEVKKLRPDYDINRDRARLTLGHREDVLKTKRVEEVLEIYPWLKVPEMLLFEMNLKFRVDLDKKIQANLESLAPALLKDGGPRLRLVVQPHIDAAVIDDVQKGLIMNTAALMIPHQFREKSSLMYLINEEPAVTTPVITFNGCPSSQNLQMLARQSDAGHVPLQAVCNPLEAENVTIWLDGVAVIKEEKLDATLATSCLFAVCWVYGIQYPSGLKNTFNFLKLFIFGTAIANNKVPVTVLGVYNSLS